MTKDERRTYIQDQSEPKKAAKEMTYWLTRDSDVDGNLEEIVDVWLSQPHMLRMPGGRGMLWICDDLMVDTANGECPSRFAQWTTAQCLKACNVYPETERECIRVGDDAPQPRRR